MNEKAKIGMKEYSKKRILVTGAAGFIGYHLCNKLIEQGEEVVGIDNMNDYYDTKLKINRLNQIGERNNFIFRKKDIVDKNEMVALFKEKYDIVVHLAAQAGVRYSLVNPHAYLDSNLAGFLNILEGCRNSSVGHLIFASSSSVYGANAKTPFSVHQNVDHPVSLYAATKKANELMAHAYSCLYQIPCTGLRFFTVYGPWGRPDMAYFSFTKSILEGKPIDVFNCGKMKRDFTYIDDIIQGLTSVINKKPQPNKDWDAKHPDAASSYAPYRLYNLGNNDPIDLDRMIRSIEDCLGKKAYRNMLAMQPGDVAETYADIDDSYRDFNFKPSIRFEEGIRRFIDWYKDYYRVDN